MTGEALIAQIILLALIGATGLFYFARAVLVGERHPAFGGYLILGISGIVCGVAGSIIIMEPMLDAAIGKDRYSEDYRGPEPAL
jgi:membrane associated rhomboid family serine protease